MKWFKIINSSFGGNEIHHSVHQAKDKVLVKRKKVGSVTSTKAFVDIGDKDTYEKVNDEYRNNR